MFYFYLNRKKDHYLFNIFLPFFTLTTSTLLVWGVDQGDLNTRITLLGSFFVAQLSLRFVTASYLPRINYSTRLECVTPPPFFFLLTVLLR